MYEVVKHFKQSSAVEMLSINLCPEHFLKVWLVDSILELGVHPTLGWNRLGKLMEIVK